MLAALALIIRGLARGSASERLRTAAVRAPAAIALGAAGLHGVYSIPRGLLSNDPVDLMLWSVAALALVAIAVGEAAGWVRRRQTRHGWRASPSSWRPPRRPAMLASALGRELGDPTLEVLFPLDDGRLVDAAGVSKAPPTDATRATIDVRRGGAPVAVLVYQADLAQDGERIAGAVDAARLTLENERLQPRARPACSNFGAHAPRSSRLRRQSVDGLNAISTTDRNSVYWPSRSTCIARQRASGAHRGDDGEAGR